MAELILACLALIISIVTLVVVLVLLGRNDFQYATKEDLQEVLDRLAIVGSNQSRLYRYAEAIDDQVGGQGHRVFIQRLPKDPTPPGN